MGSCLLCLLTEEYRINNADGGDNDEIQRLMGSQLSADSLLSSSGLRKVTPRVLVSCDFGVLTSERLSLSPQQERCDEESHPALVFIKRKFSCLTPK